MRKHFIPGVFPVLIFALLALGCNKEPASSSEPEINNNPDNFLFQATGANNATFTKEVVWENNGDSATVNQSASGSLSGAAAVTILDANGSVVYSANLTESGNFGTSSGTPGDWTIRVIFTNVSGTIQFQVLKES